MEEVKQHKTEEDAWTVLRGRVYNISPYIRFHPGGLQFSQIFNLHCSLWNGSIIRMLNHLILKSLNWPVLLTVAILVLQPWLEHRNQLFKMCD